MATTVSSTRGILLNQTNIALQGVAFAISPSALSEDLKTFIKNNPSTPVDQQGGNS